MCPECGKNVGDNDIFCPDPECRASTIPVKERKGKAQIPKEIFEYLDKKFEKVHAVGHNNVEGIKFYNERYPPKELKMARWIKEGTSLVLKNDEPYLCVEMVEDRTPMTIAGTVLLNTISDFALVKTNFRKEPLEYIMGDEKNLRYLLVVLPEPTEKSDKDIQMPYLEQCFKELNFIDNSPLKDFKICFTTNYKESLEKLLAE